MSHSAAVSQKSCASTILPPETRLRLLRTAHSALGLMQYYDDWLGFCPDFNGLSDRVWKERAQEMHHFIADQAAGEYPRVGRHKWNAIRDPARRSPGLNSSL